MALANMLVVNGMAADYAPQKVVYHINYDSPEEQVGALRNIQNHINAVGADNLDIKVVLHGRGLALLLNPEALQRLEKFKHANATDELAARIAGLRDQGVVFNVCENTVRGANVNVQSDLYDVDKQDVVSSGVAEIARLQSMGYAYMKP